MNAVRSEKPMSEEERLVRVESDIAHPQKTVEDDRKESREFRKSMDAFKEKMDDFREKMDDFRVETAKRFGDLHAEIERTRTWMVVSGAATILVYLGTAVALARYLKP